MFKVRVLFVVAALLCLVGAVKTTKWRCPKTQQVFETSSSASFRCPTHSKYHCVKAD